MNFRQAVDKTISRVLGNTQALNNMPNPGRSVSPQVAKQQMEQEIPFRTGRDDALEAYLDQYSLKGAGIGFVAPPYSSLYDRIWGITPVDDLPKLNSLYNHNPYIAAAVDVRVNLTMSQRPQLEGGNNTFRDYLDEWIDAHNLMNTARIEESDALVNGFSTTEICFDEDSQRVEWLKPLNPEFMRVRRDAYDNIFGYVQLESVPPVVFEPQRILKTTHNPGSGRHNRAYGRSLLRSALYVQALINDFSHDMALIMKVYTKPILAFTCGPENDPWSDEKIQAFLSLMNRRRQGTDVAVSRDVTITPIQSMTSQIRVEWWLNWLEKQRDAQLGVPKIFLGIPEGTNRATAEFVMQEFVTRLRTRQMQKSLVWETELFPAILAGDFPGSLIVPEKIPKIKWPPIWEPPADILTDQQIALFNAALIGDKEARTRIGLPEEVYGNLKDLRDNRTKDMPASAVSATRQTEE